MIKIGKTVIVERRSDNLFYAACQAGDDTCFVLISYSGETESLLKIAEKLRRRKIPTIVLTSFGDNSLSNMFETVIRLSTREKLVENLGNFSSLLSVSFVLDVMYASVFQRAYSKHYETKRDLSHAFEQKDIPATLCWKTCLHLKTSLQQCCGFFHIRIKIWQQCL